MGVWQGVAVDSLKITKARHARPFYTLRAGGQPGGLATVIYPYGHHTPYAYARAVFQGVSTDSLMYR
jgi:hypothetical protein